jgi:hypothetical protein
MFNWFKKKRENVYHRYVDIPCDPKIDLFSRTDYDPMYYRHVKVEKEEINPELIDWFKQFDIQFVWFEAFYTPPYGGKIPIHTDTAEYSDVVKINWTFGAPGSELMWWEVKDPKHLGSFETEFGAKYLTAEEKHCRLLYKKEIKQPSLVNIGVLHSTWNPTAEGRWTLSLPLIDMYSPERLRWNDAIERFEGLLSE